METSSFGYSTNGRTLTYEVLDLIGRAIVTGHYEDKRFPTEEELTTQHRVSRSVTREAVKMLAAKGLLFARPRQGTLIQPTDNWNLFDTDVLRWLMERSFSIDLLRQFSELRLGIEPLAAQLAAANRAGEAHAEIRSAYEQMSGAESDGDDPLDADIAFHVAILRASGNVFYMQFKDVVSTALRTSIRFTNRIEGHATSLPEHLAVLEAIEAGDGARAHIAMTKVIADVLLLVNRAANNRAS